MSALTLGNKNKRKRVGLSFRQRLARDFRVNKVVYLMLLPFIINFFLFSYLPMYGILAAFQRYHPVQGMRFISADTRWVGLLHFRNFFSSFFFRQVFFNTLRINLTDFLFGFPAPIILALLINELRSKRFARSVQTITYMPWFISGVVIAGMLLGFSQSDGILTRLLGVFGVQQVNLFTIPRYFVPLFVGSGIWQTVGWNSIIYLAAIAGVDQELYEAAKIDGAGRFKQVWHVTIPGIWPTIVILFILRTGAIMNVGVERVLLLYNPAIFETADVIATFAFRIGLLEQQWSFGTAVGLFNSVINFGLLFMANLISRRVSETSLW